MHSWTAGDAPVLISLKSFIECNCFRGDVTVMRNSQLESCVLESDGDTEDEEDSDGKLAHAAGV